MIYATALTSMTLVAAMLLPSLALAAPTPAPTAPAKPVTKDPAIEESDDAELTLRLHISVRLGRGDQAVEAEVRAQVTKVAQEAGFVVLGEEKRSPRLLYIVIERDPLDEAAYLVKLAHYSDGVTGLRRADPFGCQSCDGDALMDRILLNVAPLLDLLKEEPAPVSAPPKSAEPKPAPLSPEQPGRRRGVAMWGSGIALSAIGSGLFLGSGLGFLITNVDKEFNSNRSAGWAMLGSGAAMLAAGIPLLVIGSKRMRRGRKTRASAGYNGRMVTVGLSGRF